MRLLRDGRDGVFDDGSTVGCELVIARRGAAHGWAGRVLRVREKFVTMARGGDGRSIFLLGPASLVTWTIRACTGEEARSIGEWQRRGIPGVVLAHGGHVRPGDPRDIEVAAAGLSAGGDHATPLLSGKPQASSELGLITRGAR